MGIIKKSLFLFVVLILTSCSDIDKCYYAEDFGDIGNRDQFYIASRNVPCSYNSALEYNDESQSLEMRKCLEDTIVEKAHKNCSENTSCKDHALKKCKDIDVATNNSNTAEYFQSCVKYCSDICTKNSTADSSTWTKASLKSGSTYFGIQLNETSFITIKATGKISLSDDSNNKSSKYNKIGTNDIDYNLIISPEDDYTVTLQYNESNLSKAGLISSNNNSSNDLNIDSLKSRTILSIKNINTELINDTDDSGISDAYRFQEPLFQYLDCKNVKSKNNFGINTSDGCYLDFSGDLSLDTSLRNVLNSTYSNIKTQIFPYGDYYLYASDLLNNVNYMSYSGGVGVPVITKKDIAAEDVLKMSSDGTKILMNNVNSDVLAYVWNNNSTTFSITNNGPFKVAIRYIGNTATNCTYTASIDKYYNVSSAANDENSVIIVDTTKNYDEIPSFNFKAAGSSSNENTWNVLKTPVGVNSSDLAEIVFNQFSTPTYTLNSTLTLSIKNDKNSSAPVNGDESFCNKGLLIYLIPLKDYQVYDNGLLYFYTPKNLSSDTSVYYSIINPGVISANSNLLKNPDRKLKEFYEATTNFEAFGLRNINNKYINQSIKVLTYKELVELENSDSPDSSKYFSNDKTTFVRKNQLIRFDYSNWFSIDNLKEIKKNTIQYTNKDGNSITVDFPLLLNAVIKSKYPFICFGSANETISFPAYCSSKDMEYKQIYIDSLCTAENTSDFGNDITKCTGANNNKDLCLVNNKVLPSCHISENIAIKYLGKLLEYKNISDEDIANLNDQKKTVTEKNIAKFLLEDFRSFAELLYNCNDDENCTVPENKDAIDEITAELYTLARNCLNTLSANTNIIIVKGTNDSKKVKYSGISTEKLLPNKDENSKDLTNKEKYQKMIELFLTKDLTKTSIEDESGADKEITSEVFYNYFNIYKEIREIDTSIPKTQCYDLSNFIGSTKEFISNTGSSNNDSANEDVINYGNMSKDYIALGAKKVQNFSQNNPGNISHFEIVKDYSNFNKDLDCSSGGKCVAIKHNSNIASSTKYTLSINVLNKLSQEQISSYDNNFIEYFKYESKSSPIYATKDSLLEYKTNGDRLAVIIAENGYNYTGDITNNLNTNLKAHSSELFNLPVTRFTSYDKDNLDSNYYYPLVYYPGDNSSLEQSEYFFNDAGLLTDRKGSSAIDVKNNNIIKKYINTTKDSNFSQKNLFFKITDTDNNSENNSGNYQVVIKEYTENNYDNMIDIFRNFFDTILTFVDGNSISLLSIKDSTSEIIDRVVKCDKEGINNIQDLQNVKCHVYQPGSENHGKICNTGDINCFIDCIGQGTNSCFKFNDGKGFVEGVYKTIITNPLYVLLLKIALILSISLYGFGYFFGLTSFKQSEIIGKIFKLSFFYLMATSAGWEFFNKYIATFFKSGVDSVLFLIASSFETDFSSELMQAVEMGDYSDKIVLFSGALDNLELLLSDAIFSKIVGLFFSGWIGPIYFYFVITTLLTYLVAVISSIVIYLSIQIYMSLIFCFFPLIIIFTFFKKSEDTFKNWLNMLIGFAGQQILLVTTLSFFNMLIYNFIKTTFSYTVCWLPLLDINLGGFPVAILSFYKIPGTGITNTGINAGNEAMPSFYTIIGFYMVGVLMGKFITSMTSLGNSIFGGGLDVTKDALTSSITGGVNEMKGKLDKKMKETGSNFYGKLGNLAGGKYIEREGNGRLREMRKKEDDFKKELDTRTAKGLTEKKETDDYKRKVNNINFKNRNKAAAEVFANDSEFLEKYQEALDGKEDDGTNKEANEIVSEYLSSDKVNGNQKKEVNKKANAGRKNDIRELDRGIEKEIRKSEAKNMLSDKESQYYIGNQFPDKNDKIQEMFDTIDEEDFDKVVNDFGRSRGYFSDEEKEPQKKPEDKPIPETKPSGNNLGSGTEPSGDDTAPRPEPNTGNEHHDDDDPRPEDTGEDEIPAEEEEGTE